MRSSARGREARLEAVLERLDAQEERALADLRVAGYRFNSAAEARSHRKALVTKRRLIAEQGFVFTDRQFEIALRAVEREERKRDGLDVG